MTEPGVNIASPPEPVQPIPPRYWWLKRILLAVVALLALFGLLRWLVGMETERRLFARVDELRAAGEPMLPEDFEFPDVPDSDNAAIPLRKAAEAFTNAPAGEASVELLLSGPELFPAHAEAARAILNANAESLRYLRDARSRSSIDWGHRFDSPMLSTVKPGECMDLQRVARVACLAAFEELSRGSQAKAFEHLFDVLSMGDRLNAGHPLLIESLVGAVMSQEVLAVVRQIAAQPIAARSEAERMINKLLDESQLAEGFTRAFRAERAMMLDVTPGMAGSRVMLSTAGRGNSLREMFACLDLWLCSPILQLDAIRILEHYSSYVEASQEPSLPLVNDALSHTRVPTFGTLLQRRTRFLSALVMPDFGDTLQTTLIERAERRLAATALAIRLYQDDHGHRPETLDELTPDYLPFVPSDPTVPGDQAILYVPTGSDPHVGFRSSQSGEAVTFSLVGKQTTAGENTSSQPASEERIDERDGIKRQPGDPARNEDPDGQP